MINYIVYSHSEFHDILKIQTDYLSDISNKILLIDKNDSDLTHIYSKYKDVIYYDDSLPYASRLLSLKELDLEYILFIHDIDIVIKRNDDFINRLPSIMDNNKIDRIDLQWHNQNHNIHTERISISNDCLLIKQENINKYIYNVNPSIWRISVFMDIMDKFRNESYRTIEVVTQSYCSQFRIFKLWNDTYVNCGWFPCLPFFQFMHITHGGKLLPFNNSINNLNYDIHIEYEKIRDNYLSNTTRQESDRRLGLFYHG